MKEPIYPSIYIKNSPNGEYEIFSYLRKKHTDGKWYLIPMTKKLASIDLIDQYKGIGMFHIECYAALIKTIIIPGGGGPCWHILDENQQEEAERIASW